MILNYFGLPVLAQNVNRNQIMKSRKRDQLYLPFFKKECLKICCQQNTNLDVLSNDYKENELNYKFSIFKLNYLYKFLPSVSLNILKLKLVFRALSSLEFICVRIHTMCIGMCMYMYRYVTLFSNYRVHFTNFLKALKKISLC